MLLKKSLVLPVFYCTKISSGILKYIYSTCLLFLLLAVTFFRLSMFWVTWRVLRSILVSNCIEILSIEICLLLCSQLDWGYVSWRENYRGKGLFSLHHVVNMIEQVMDIFITVDANSDQLAEVVLIVFFTITYPFSPCLYTLHSLEGSHY